MTIYNIILIFHNKINVALLSLRDFQITLKKIEW